MDGRLKQNGRVVTEKQFTGAGKFSIDPDTAPSSCRGMYPRIPTNSKSSAKNKFTFGPVKVFFANLVDVKGDELVGVATKASPRLIRTSITNEP